MPKIVNHQERRQAIANAAIEVISERGLGDTKLVDIARIAGVTTGAITHYFSDKDAVLSAAQNGAYNRLFCNMDKVCQSGDYSFYQVMAQSLPITDQSRRAMSVWFAFWSRSLSRAKVSEEQRAFHRAWHQRVRKELLAHYQRKAQKPPAAIDDTCEAITAHLNGLVIRGLVDAPEWPAQRQKKFLKTYLTQIGLV